MNLPYFQVDAFTQRLFSGNPAGVCPLETWLPDSVLQSIALENGLSETAFFIRNGSRFPLRWFTPSVEVDLCGHATLAAAHVLFRHLGHPGPRAEFETRSGLLTVDLDEECLTLNFPARPGIECAPPADLVRGLGVRPQATFKSRDYMAVLDSEETVRNLQPDLEILRQVDCLGIIATAPGDSCDFVSRFFAPRAGVPEDPVTGSAHCTLIPYWADRLQRKRLRALQVSRRGGELFCEQQGERVRIGGRAVTYSTGTLSLS
ncbi:MAG: PhzF family phenazine biosynthesis protein [Verrucomicrobiales bacterium]|nr:PhzF family phenazine biosynthesis protein [Verrucomicrobiales bacterium]